MSVNTTTLGVNKVVGETERKLIAEIARDARLDRSKGSPRINEWEAGFIESLYNGSLKSTHNEIIWTPRQQETLARIERKLYK